MNSLKTLRIQEACRVAQHHPAIAGQRRNAPPAAVRQRLGAVADHLSAFEQLGDKRVFLELLQHVLWVEAWIAVIESGYKTQRDLIVFGAVDPRTAVFAEG